MTILKTFLGLNNVADALIGTPSDGNTSEKTWEFQSRADNVDIDDANAILRRDGFTQVNATAITSAYSTADFTRSYVVAAGQLCELRDDGSLTSLGVTVGTAACYWEEINNDVLLSTFGAKWVIHADGTTRPLGVPTPASVGTIKVSGTLTPGTYRFVSTLVDSTGREGGTSAEVEVAISAGEGLQLVISCPAGYSQRVYATMNDDTVFNEVGEYISGTFSYHARASGATLTTMLHDAPPLAAEQMAFFQGSLYLAEYMPQANQTVIWFSKPLAYHLFNLDSDFILLPGKLTQLAAGEALLLATDVTIHIYDGNTLTKVANYGGVPGENIALTSEGKLFFWTQRGLCSLMPFANMTETRLSLPPGVTAGGGVIDRHGFSKYVVHIQQGGDAYNPRSSS